MQLNTVQFEMKMRELAKITGKPLFTVLKNEFRKALGLIVKKTGAPDSVQRKRIDRDVSRSVKEIKSGKFFGWVKSAPNGVRHFRRDGKTIRVEWRYTADTPAQAARFHTDKKSGKLNLPKNPRSAYNWIMLNRIAVQRANQAVRIVQQKVGWGRSGWGTAAKNTGVKITGGAAKKTPGGRYIEIQGGKPSITAINTRWKGSKSFQQTVNTIMRKRYNSLVGSVNRLLKGEKVNLGL